MCSKCRVPHALLLPQTRACGLNATFEISPSCPVSVCTHSPVAVLYKRAVPSALWGGAGWFGAAVWASCRRTCSSALQLGFARGLKETATHP